LTAHYNKLKVICNSFIGGYYKRVSLICNMEIPRV